MKKHFLLIGAILMLLNISTEAQQALFGGQEIISPEVNKNNTVTFRVNAPNAKEVKLSGDWMPAEGWTPGSVPIQKNDSGIWEYTTDVLEPELYSYSFSIDGFKTTDPNNPFLIRDVASVTNIFIVGGGQADLYKVNDIPHGTVARPLV